MSTDGKTIFVSEAPISNLDDKTVFSFDFSGPLNALTGLTIAASCEVSLPVLLAHLQAMWDKEELRSAHSGHESKAAA